MTETNATRAAGSSAPDCSRILVTIEITDPETVEAYQNVDDALVFEDLRDGTLMQMASLVSRANARPHAERSDSVQADVRMPDLSVCPRCGKPGSHFVPPSLGEPGMFICDPNAEHQARAIASRPECGCSALCKQCAAEQRRSVEWDTYHYGTNRACDACGREGLCAMMPNNARALLANARLGGDE